MKVERKSNPTLKVGDHIYIVHDRFVPLFDETIHSHKVKTNTSISQYGYLDLEIKKFLPQNITICEDDLNVNMSFTIEPTDLYFRSVEEVVNYIHKKSGHKEQDATFEKDITQVLEPFLKLAEDLLHTTGRRYGTDND
jgi:hypothetical protein